MDAVRGFLHDWRLVLLIIHVGVTAAMIVVILLQRSEGGGLGMGRTDALEAVAPFAHLADGSAEGAQAGRVTGTYLHGIFEHADVVRQTLGMDLPPIPKKCEMYDRLADWLVAHSEPTVLEDLVA